MSGGFVDTPYIMLCYECDAFVKRSCGMIPELYSDKYFPQVSAPLDLDDMKNGFKKPTKWTIRFRGESRPHTKKLKNRLMDLGCALYIRDFPETPHTVKMIKRLVNSHKLYDKMYEKW
jgi:hypothetical protein